MVLERKQTEIGLIPEDWEVVRLGEVAELIMGQSPPGDTYNEMGKGMPFLQGKAEFGTISPKHVKYTTKPLKIAPKGSVLISVRAPVGDVNIADIEYCIGRGLSSLSLSKGENAFLFFLLNYFKNEIEKEGTGSTFKAINKSKVQEFKIPHPPLPEQKKIARVLSTIQRAIEQQDKIIEATRKLKKSLLHKSFTEGLNGEEQKETEIGRVPKSWDVLRLGDVCKQRKEQILPTEEGKFRYIGLEHIDSGETRLKRFGYDNEVRSSKYEFYAGDILYGKLRPYLDKAVKADFEGICSTDIIVITVDESRIIIPDYLVNLLHLPFFVHYATSTMTGVNHPRTSWRAISAFKIPFPPLSEQQQIAHILNTVDKKIEIEERRKATLKELFKTMLHKLMSGEMRLKEVEI